MEKGKKVSSENLIFLSVIVPAYNEENVILDTIKSIDSFLGLQGYTYEIIISNNASTDNTLSLVENYAKTSKNLVIINLDKKGKALAVTSGMKKAVGRYVLFTDADNATPIQEVKKLLHYLEDGRYDIAIGSREGTGAVRHNEPLVRHLMGRVYTMLVKAMLFSGIEDTQCGFKLFSRNSIQKILPRLQIFSEERLQHTEIPGVNAGFDVELLYVAKKLGLKIKPVPVEWTYGEGTKVNKFKDSWIAFTGIVKVWLNSKKGKYN